MHAAFTKVLFVALATKSLANETPRRLAPASVLCAGEQLCGAACEPKVWCSVYDGNQAACENSYVERAPGGVFSGLYSRCEYNRDGDDRCTLTQDYPGNTCDPDPPPAPSASCAGAAARAGSFPVLRSTWTVDPVPCPL